jgi:hypothetical protein
MNAIFRPPVPKFSCMWMFVCTFHAQSQLGFGLPWPGPGWKSREGQSQSMNLNGEIGVPSAFHAAKLGAKLAPSDAPLSMFARAALTGVVAAPGAIEPGSFAGSQTGPPPEQLTTSPLSTAVEAGALRAALPIPALQGKSRRPSDHTANARTACYQFADLQSVPSRHPMQLRNTTRPATGQQTG